MSTNSSTGRRATGWVWLAAIALAILHQDFWFWADRRLVLGFMPIGLAYHALFSLLAGCLWAVVVKVAWPTGLEAWAEESEHEPDSAPPAGPEPPPSQEKGRRT